MYVLWLLGETKKKNLLGMIAAGLRAIEREGSLMENSTGKLEKGLSVNGFVLNKEFIDDWLGK